MEKDQGQKNPSSLLPRVDRIALVLANVREEYSTQPSEVDDALVLEAKANYAKGTYSVLEKGSPLVDYPMRPEVETSFERIWEEQQHVLDAMSRE